MRPVKRHGRHKRCSFSSVVVALVLLSCAAPFFSPAESCVSDPVPHVGAPTDEQQAKWILYKDYTVQGKERQYAILAGVYNKVKDADLLERIKLLADDAFEVASCLTDTLGEAGISVPTMLRLLTVGEESALTAVLQDKTLAWTHIREMWNQAMVTAPPEALTNLNAFKAYFDEKILGTPVVSGSRLLYPLAEAYKEHGCPSDKMTLLNGVMQVLNVYYGYGEDFQSINSTYQFNGAACKAANDNKLPTDSFKLFVCNAITDPRINNSVTVDSAEKMTVLTNTAEAYRDDIDKKYRVLVTPQSLVPSTPRLVPAGGINPKNPTFSWTPSSCLGCGAVRYTFLLQREDGSEPEIEREVSETGLTLELLTPSVAYRWTVYPKNELEIENRNVPFQSFTPRPLYTKPFTKPKALFNVDQHAGDTLTDFQFTSTSIGGNLQYSWNFGDGEPFTSWWSSSSKGNQSHRYANPGIYEVTLVVRTLDIQALSTSYSQRVTVEIAPENHHLPYVEITQGPQGPTSNTSPTFGYQGTTPHDDEGKVIGYYCGVDVQDRLEGDSPDESLFTSASAYTSPALPVGSHTFTVRAKDNAGSLSPMASRSFTVEAPLYATSRSGVDSSMVTLSPGETGDFIVVFRNTGNMDWNSGPPSASNPGYVELHAVGPDGAPAASPLYPGSGSWIDNSGIRITAPDAPTVFGRPDCQVGFFKFKGRVPPDAVTGTFQAWFRLYNTATDTTFGEPASITVQVNSSPQLTILAPVSGEKITGGRPYTVRWIAQDDLGIHHLDLVAIKDDGTILQTIASDIVNTGFQSWTPPNTTTAAVLRITASDSVGHETRVETGPLQIFENGHFQIGGSVKDSSSNPIAQATVTLTPHSGGSPLLALTTNLGAYVLSDLGAGSYQAHVYADGYSFSSNPSEAVKLDAANPSATVDFMGTLAACPVQGHVRGGDGLGIAAIRVTAQNNGKSASVQTGQDGLFVIHLPPATYSIVPDSLTHAFSPIGRQVVLRSTDASLPDLDFTATLKNSDMTAVTDAAHIASNLSTYGAAWGDYDNDGYEDLYLANGGHDIKTQANLLVHNLGNGTFEPVTATAGVADGGHSLGAVWADFNGDGYLDLYVVNVDHPNRLYRNNLDGTFTDVASAWGVAWSTQLSLGRHAECAAFADYDRNGWLDLFVGSSDGPSRLYRNTGVKFVEVTQTARLDALAAGGVTGCSWADFDGDGFIDLYVGRGNAPSMLYRNMGNGTFQLLSREADSLGAYGVVWGDFNNDGALDLFVNASSGQRLFMNNGDGTFSDVTVMAGLDFVSDTYGGAAWLDYDNDGWLDLYVGINGGKLYHNNGDETFTDVTASSGAGTSGIPFAVVTADYDNDGTSDLFLGESTSNVLLRGTPLGNHYAKVLLQDENGANRFGVGAVVRLTADGLSQVRTVTTGSGTSDMSSMAALFGLATSSVYDVRVRWPDGKEEGFANLAADTKVVLKKGAGLALGPLHAVTDLRVGDVSADTVTLGWTAPGSEGSAAAAASYDLRFAPFSDRGNSIFDEATWSTATPASGVNTPAVPGTRETYVLRGLTAGTLYAMALKSLDSTGSSSNLSNVVWVVPQPWNSPPTLPGSPNPPDGAVGQPPSVVLTWLGGDPDPTDTVSYDLWFGPSGQPMTLVGTLSGTTLTMGPLSEATAYSWQVIAGDDHGNRVEGPVWTFRTTEAAPPEPPTALSAVFDGTAVTLSWIDQASNETGFIIERKTGLQGTYSQIGLVTGPSFTDGAVRKGHTTLFYRVKACNNAGESIPSNETTVVLPNHAPRFLSNPPGGIMEGQKYLYLMTAEDQDEDALSFSAISKPDQMAVMPSTGQVVWIPGAGDVGDHAITLRVSDGDAQTDQSFVVKVSSTNHPPQITAAHPVDRILPPDQTHPGYPVTSSISFAVSAMDTDPDTVLSYQWTVDGIPRSSAPSLDYCPGVSYGTHTAKVQVKVSDGSLSAYHQWSVRYRGFNILVLSGPNGSISPSGNNEGMESVEPGGTKTFSIQPQACYAVKDVIVDAQSKGSVNSYTFTNISADGVIAAGFAPLGPYTITASVEDHGSIAPSGAVSVNCGESKTFVLTPDAGYEVKDILVDGASAAGGAAAAYTFPNVTSDHTIKAVFVKTPVITASAGEHGSVSPAGEVPVKYGSDQTFSITPDPGFLIDDVLVDGVSVGRVSSYTFPAVVSDHSLSASFAVNRPPIADAGPRQKVGGGVTVLLNGANSTDPDDGIVAYLWEQVSGPSVEIKNMEAAQASFASPDPGSNGFSLTFRLTVTDKSGTTSSDSCIVNVTRDKLPPVASAGFDKTVTEAETAETEILDGSGSYDPDGLIAAYVWEQLDGPPVTLANPSASQTGFTAPAPGGEDVSMTFRLTVVDEQGLKSSDTCIVNVSANDPPLAVVKPDQNAYEGDRITLDGSQSTADSGGDVASYRWKQIQGTPVTLDDPTAAQPQFVAPQVGPDGESLTFLLTVVDARGLRATNTFAIFVASPLTLTTPNGAEVWNADKTVTLSWYYWDFSARQGLLGPVTEIRIELLKGNAVPVVIAQNVPVGTEGSGSFDWLIPASQPPGDDYRVRITSTSDSAYTDTSDGTFTILPPVPVAGFAADPTVGKARLTVQFTDLSKGPVTQWKWDFGDGRTSTEQNPGHEYENPKTYTVALFVTGPGGSSTEVKTDYIEVVWPMPKADFRATPTTGIFPLEVRFTDLSSAYPGDTLNWSWDFGDGGQSTHRNPTHVYNNPGKYTVILTTTGLGGSGTKTAPEGIVVQFPPPPIADFRIPPGDIVTGKSVPFKDLSTGTMDKWLWDFGDGGKSSTQNPTHTYKKGGTYTVTLVVSGPGGPSNAKADQVTVHTPPVANFTASPTKGKGPLKVQFTDTSTHGPTTWLWNFGDGTDSNDKDPQHTYDKAGSYDVTLTVGGPGQTTSSKTIKKFIVVYPRPVADFTGKPLAGKAPLSVKFADASKGVVSSWLWRFGDGAAGSGQNPTHKYMRPGIYDVSLHVMGPGGEKELKRNDYISARGLIVNNPVRNTVWRRGETRSIQWSNNGEVKEKVKLALLDRNSRVVSIISNGCPAENGKTDAFQCKTGSFRWAIPQKTPPGFGYTIQISGVGNPSEFSDRSDEFRIESPVRSTAGPDQRERGAALVKLSGANSITPDKERTVYHWTQLKGPPVVLSDPGAVEPTFVAPDAGFQGRSLVFQLQISEGEESPSTDTCIVNVTAGNRPPTADAGLDQDVREGTLVTLDASASMDPDDEIVSYHWVQLEGRPVVLSHATAMKPTFQAPEVGPDGESLVFRLLVADEGGLQSQDRCVVTVLGVNNPPVANAGQDQTPAPGSLAVLDGSGSSDADGGIASYEWTQVSGRPISLSDPSSAMPTFSTLDLEGETEEMILVFRLTVVDTGGLKHADRVTVTISGR